MSKGKREIAVALDFSNREEFLKTYESLKSLNLVFKVGLKVFPRLEKSDWKSFSGKKLFVDAKLHDIPSQVADAVAAYGDLGARYLTVHLSGGPKMLEEAQKRAAKYKITLLGVSALTSLSDADLREIGFNDGSQNTVERLVKLGLKSGLNSFVMSTWELGLKAKHPEIYCVTPGISLESQNTASDQARTATLKEALSMGSDMPVIGRAIVNSPNPKNAAQSALEMLSI